MKRTHFSAVVGNGYGLTNTGKAASCSKKRKSLREIGKTDCYIMALLADDRWKEGVIFEERKKFGLVSLIYLTLIHVSKCSLAVS